MQKFGHILTTLLAVSLLTLSACSEEAVSPGADDSRDEMTNLTLRISLDSDVASAADSELGSTRAGFDNFDNELDKWSTSGENIEQLRIIIVSSDGFVEYNKLYTASNSVREGEYTFLVKSNDTKKIFLIANEKGYYIDDPGMSYTHTSTSMGDYFAAFQTGDYVDTDRFDDIVLSMRPNSVGELNKSLRTPLPCTAVYTEEIGTDDIERTYWMNRAAVKYSFRIINESDYNHKLEGIRIDRVADCEYLFPHASYGDNEYGHREVTSYRTPSIAKESLFSIDFDEDLYLPKHMTDAVVACPSFYVPEGLVGSQAQKVSISLDGTPLAIWGDLKWLMPGETVAKARDMVDLPRNSHVVVNITIKDNNVFEMVADVQPYAGVEVKPFFGLDRDPDGNIVTARYDDDTYDVLINGVTVTRDLDNDRVIKKFADGTLYCSTRVQKDYIHDENENEYRFYIEKDRSGGNMVILRQRSAAGVHHGSSDQTQHNHGMDDRPLFVLTPYNDFQRIYYDADNIAYYSDYDPDGADILQANGFQFDVNGSDENVDDSDMFKYVGTYLVVINWVDDSGVSRSKQELRWYLEDYSTTGPTRRLVDSDLGVEWPWDDQNDRDVRFVNWKANDYAGKGTPLDPNPDTRAAGKVVSTTSAADLRIFSMMRAAHQRFMRLYNPWK